MKEIHRLITENNVSGALNYLLSNFPLSRNDRNAILLLTGQFAEIEKKELLNLSNSEELNIGKNRIRKAILSYGDKYEETDKGVSPNEINSFDFNFERFIGMGNEPGWSLRLSNQNIIFVSDYGETTHAYEIVKKFSGKDIWYFRSNKPLFKDQAFISINITKEVWRDDMSGHEYPFRVEINESFRYYLGVGQIRN